MNCQSVRVETGVTLETEAYNIAETEINSETKTARDEEFLLPEILEIALVRSCSSVVKTISCTYSCKHICTADSLVIKSTDKAGKIHKDISTQLSVSERIDSLLRDNYRAFTLPSAESEAKAECMMKLPLEVQSGSR